MATTSRTLRRSSSALLLAAAVAVPVLAAAPAEAKGGSPAVQCGGACIGGGVWKLKAEHDAGRIEIEYQVDTNRPGQTWRVMVTDNNVFVFNGTRTTTAPAAPSLSPCARSTVPALTSSAPRPRSPATRAPGPSGSDR